MKEQPIYNTWRTLEQVLAEQFNWSTIVEQSVQAVLLLLAEQFNWSTTVEQASVQANQFNLLQNKHPVIFYSYSPTPMTGVINFAVIGVSLQLN